MQVVEEIQNLVPAVDPGGEGQGEGYRSAGEVFKPLFAVGKIQVAPGPPCQLADADSVEMEMQYVGGRHQGVSPWSGCVSGAVALSAR